MSRLLIRAADATETWRPPARWALACAALAAILSLDAATGLQVTLAFLYLLVTGFAAWSFGESKGLLFAVLVSLCATGLRHVQYAAQPDHAMTLATEIWNAFARILSTGMVAILVAGMRSALRLERWRASTDALTGVLNKASFSLRMCDATAQARESGRALVLCYMDLDGFKAVNDLHGHSAGDTILRLFADAAIEAIREGDLFARIGGDEFVALLTVPTADDADRIATLVHRRLSKILAATGLPITFSMGALVASAGQLEPFDTAVQLADALMYEVKRTGKDALRVGRIDPATTPLPLDRLEIQSGGTASPVPGKSPEIATGERRVA